MESLPVLGVIDYDMSEVFDFENLDNHIIMDPFMVQMPDQDSSMSRVRSSSISSSASCLANEASPVSFFDTQSEADLQKSTQAMQDSPSSVSSSDFPLSPLSEGAEASYWQKNEKTSFELPARTSDNDFVQNLLKPTEPESSCTASALPQLEQRPVPARKHPLESSPPATSVPRAQTRQAEAHLNGSSHSGSSKGVSLDDSSKVMQSNSKTVKSKGVKRKAEEIVEESSEVNVAEEASLTRNEKNALAARENRLKKKRELEDLKYQKESLESENVTLRKENSEHLKTIETLEEEVKYYKSLLFNHSDLARFLQSMNPCPTVKLSSSVGVSSKDRVPAASGMSGGVCIHVNGQDASLEFCSKCSLNANYSFNS